MTTKVEYKIQFGMDYDKDGNYLKDSEEHVQEVLEIVSETFGGCSLINTTGARVDDTGKLICENSKTLQIMALDDDRSKVLDIAKFIKNILNQQSVLVTSLVLSSGEFI